MKESLIVVLALFLSMLVWAPFAAAETVFGPKQYFHTKGQADVYNDTFSATPGDATIVVTSGEG